MLRWSFGVTTSAPPRSRGEALQQMASGRRQVPDLGLPPAPDDASEVPRSWRSLSHHETKVIVVTGTTQARDGRESRRAGRCDYYQNLSSRARGSLVERAFRLSELEAANRRNEQRGGCMRQDHDRGEKMLKLCRTVEKVRPQTATVHLLGESGTGKELLARADSQPEPTARAIVVVIRLRRDTETLLEATFRTERGAFTGAVRQVKGKIELAQRGTLFLDEIGDMSLALQVKLLRFLQERIIERIGGREKIAVDTRVICATNRNLREQIGRNEFRDDLFYRISQVTIEIPPLRERDDDVVLLARYFPAPCSEPAASGLASPWTPSCPARVAGLQRARAGEARHGPGGWPGTTARSDSVERRSSGHVTPRRPAEGERGRSQALNAANGVLGVKISCKSPHSKSLMKDLDINGPFLKALALRNLCPLQVKVSARKRVAAVELGLGVAAVAS